MIFKNTRNLLPYFLLISIYFFFVNIEARKEKNINKIIEKQINLPDYKDSVDNMNRKLSIPVIPYK